MVCYIADLHQQIKQPTTAKEVTDLKPKITLLILTVILLLSGCGKSPELSAFKLNIENFCTNLSVLDSSINSIDPGTDASVEELLKYVDQMQEQYTALSSITFPEEFSYLQDLAAEADEYMKEASDAFHSSCEGNTFDESMYDYAIKNYRRAYKRIQLLMIYLRGETPSENDLISE